MKYEGEILLNGVYARSIDRLKEGDQLTLTLFDEKGNYVPVESELTVLYEDKDFLVQMCIRDRVCCVLVWCCCPAWHR